MCIRDRAYVDFAGGRDCLELAKTLPNVLVCRTLSKSYSLAGLRLGWAIGSPELIGALYKLKDSYNVDGLAQAVALAALGDVGWMQTNARRIVATRERVAAKLAERGFRAVSYTHLLSRARCASSIATCPPITPNCST